jgi:hypothetical protein
LFWGAVHLELKVGQPTIKSDESVQIAGMRHLAWLYGMSKISFRFCRVKIKELPSLWYYLMM